MLLQSVLCVLLSWGVIGSCQTIGYFYQNGQTRVLGSSFGLLGTNATFDYVVSTTNLQLSREHGFLTLLDYRRRHLRSHNGEAID